MGVSTILIVLSVALTVSAFVVWKTAFREWLLAPANILALLAFTKAPEDDLLVRSLAATVVAAVLLVSLVVYRRAIGHARGTLLLFGATLIALAAVSFSAGLSPGVQKVLMVLFLVLAALSIAVPLLLIIRTWRLYAASRPK